MFRTPVQNRNEDSANTKAGNTTFTTEAAGPMLKEDPPKSVRRSIGEWESGKPDSHSKTKTTPKKVVSAEPLKPKPRTVISQESGLGARRSSVEVKESSPKPEKGKYVDRLSEARACVSKAKLHLGNSRNLKTEIKNEVLQAVDRLYSLIKESEYIKAKINKPTIVQETVTEPKIAKVKEVERENSNTELMKKLAEHSQLLTENTAKMEVLREALERKTYASAVAAPVRSQYPEQETLHSVVVTAKDEMETAGEVLNRIRAAVNAKDGGVLIDKIRKAKDQKVIIGCRTEEEREKVKDRLKKAGEHLNVEDIKNKNPLVILRDVLTYNKDEEIISALHNQNTNLLKGLSEGQNKIEIAFKKRTKNPHTNHVVLRVSPMIWQRLLETGFVRIDLQRIRVADQSPLVQCSLCLGYGHGRRFCTDTVEKCSHCGGSHMKATCAEWLAGTVPSCCNCTQAKLEKTDHNAFSQECAIRRRWEVLARATVAYC